MFVRNVRRFEENRIRCFAQPPQTHDRRPDNSHDDNP